MLYLVLALIGLMFSSISTFNFPTGYIYSNASRKRHRRSVALPSYHSESQGEADVELNNHLTYTKTNPAKAPWHVFCLLEGETTNQLPVNDRFDSSIAVLHTLTDGRKGAIK